MSAGRAASIQARLLAGAKARGEDFNLVLGRFAAERLLYRLSVSAHRERFCLKDALLFAVWFEVPHRPTRDVDLLGFGPEDPVQLHRVFADVCALDQDDGLAFEAASLRIEPIRETARYGGLRVRLRAHLGRARCPVQVDVGYGDAVTPGSEEVTLPSLLTELPAPKLRAYPKATAIAEKLEAIVQLGMANTRMKDYYDLFLLQREADLDEATVIQAIRATFARRGTPVPARLPLGLDPEFSLDPSKQAQWRGFLVKNRMDAPGLPEVVEGLGGRFLALFRAAGQER